MWGASCQGRKPQAFQWLVAAREGFEPPTLALGKLCSILLSYRATRETGPGWAQALLPAPDAMAGGRRQDRRKNERRQQPKALSSYFD